MLFEQTDQRGVVRLRVVREELVVVTPAADRLTFEHDLVDRAIPDVGKERRIRNGRNTLIARPEALKDRQQDDCDDNPENDVLCQIVQCVTSQTA
jgi:hypothetical protein